MRDGLRLRKPVRSMPAFQGKLLLRHSMHFYDQRRGKWAGMQHMALIYGVILGNTVTTH